jgi:Big-like domain-containing protein
VLFGNGSGSFERAEALQYEDEPSNPLGFAVRDFDGDGRPDIALIARDARLDVLLTNKAVSRAVPFALSLQAKATQFEYGRSTLFTATLSDTRWYHEALVRFETADRVLGIASTSRRQVFPAMLVAAFGLSTQSVRATALRTSLFAEMTATPLGINVQRAQTTVSIYGLKNPVQTNETLQVIVKIDGTWSDAGFRNATGSVVVSEGATILFTVPIRPNDGTTAVEVTLPAGSHTLTAEYAGDDFYHGASASYEQVVTRPIATVTLTGTPASPVEAGTAVTLTATLLFSDATGIITFKDQTPTTLPSVVGTAPIANGSASLTLNLSGGSHRFTAVYAGDAKYLGATSAQKTWVATQAFSVGPTVSALEVLPDSYTVAIWTPVTGAVGYDVELSVGGSAFTKVGTTTSQTNWSDDSIVIQPWTTCVYRVTARNANGNLSPSGMDAVTIARYTDVSLTGQLIKAQHLLELAAAVNAFRTAMHLAPFTYSAPPAQGGVIRAATLQELRTALRQARTALGQTTAFTNESPAGVVVQKVHLQELRDALK